IKICFLRFYAFIFVHITAKFSKVRNCQINLSTSNKHITMGFINTSLVRKISTCSLCAFLLLGITSACTKSASGEQQEPPVPAEQPTLRVMSYNIHWATGTDGILSLPRIAEVIKGSQADVVVLNEVDRHYDPRSQYEDQLQYLADEL